MKNILTRKFFGLSIRRAGWLGLVVMLVMFVPIYSQEKADEEPDNITERFTISIGKEIIYYKQREPDTATTSSVEVTNTVLSIRWFEQWEYFISGLAIVIPVSSGEERETQNAYGKAPYRTNKFSYEWTRIDGYIGYSLFEGSHHSIPAMVYTGLRLSKVEQSRENFIVLGNPLGGSTKEKIKSWGLLLGFGVGSELSTHDYSWFFGEIEPKPHSDWVWYWGLEGSLPLSVKVTDSTMPGVSFKKETGYSIETRGSVGCALSESLLFEASIYVGVVSWEGSDWKDTPYGLVKWPENKTDYAGMNLSLTLKF